MHLTSRQKHQRVQELCTGPSETTGEPTGSPCATADLAAAQQLEELTQRLRRSQQSCSEQEEQVISLQQQLMDAGLQHQAAASHIQVLQKKLQEAALHEEQVNRLQQQLIDLGMARRGEAANLEALHKQLQEKHDLDEQVAQLQQQLIDLGMARQGEAADLQALHRQLHEKHSQEEQVVSLQQQLIDAGLARQQAMGEISGLKEQLQAVSDAHEKSQRTGASLRAQVRTILHVGGVPSFLAMQAPNVLEAYTYKHYC